MTRAVAAALLLAVCGGATAAAERIAAFETRLELSGDDAFRVTETLAYDFGAGERHGIYREIPVRYGRGRAADYRIGLEVESVTDELGMPRPWRTSRRGRVLRIRIGDPDRTVGGVQTYRIVYRVSRGILYFEDHDELYWNATGTDWSQPIERAVAEVRLPEGADPAGLELACFTGRQGSLESHCSIDRGAEAVRFASDRPLGARQGLTLVVGLPKGVLREPGRFQRLLARASDYLSTWLLLPLAAFAGMFATWRSLGRDPPGGAAIPVRYEPPPGMRPAEVGTVHDESADIDDVTSTLLDLAVRGHLRIEEEESNAFLFLSSRDYALERLEGDDADLVSHERELLRALFEHGRRRVRVSELKNRFYKKLPDVRDALYDRVVREDGYFPASPRRVRRLWAMVGLLLGGPGGVALFSEAGAFEPGLAFALSGAVVLGFSRVMPRRTRRGRRAYEEILGFKEFVERVDADRLERSGGRDADRFERVLPFAVVLGVADEWAGAFRDIYTEPPSWYRSSRHGGHFGPRGFVDDLGGLLRTTGASMTSRPRQSGSGSSGLGGGGFSGGGFGGGGGGSW